MNGTFWASRRANNCAQPVTGAGWSAWKPISNSGFQGAPALTYRRPFVYVVGRKGTALRWGETDPVTLSTINDGRAVRAVPGGATASPELMVTCTANNTFGDVHLAIRNANGVMHVSSLDIVDASWGPWQAVSGTFVGGPALTRGAGGTIWDLYGRGLDNGIYQTSGALNCASVLHNLNPCRVGPEFRRRFSMRGGVVSI